MANRAENWAEVEMENIFYRAAKNDEQTLAYQMLNITPSSTDWLAVKGTALQLAATYGNVKIATMLLNSGVSHQAKDSALRMAAESGDMDSVSLLLKAGASPHTKNPGPQVTYDYALTAAADNGHYKIVELLVAQEPSEQIKDMALYNAAGSGHIKIVELLLDRGVSQKGKEDALIDAALNGESKIVDLLLKPEHGVSAATKEAALWYGALRGQTDVATQLIVEHGVNGQTMLQRAQAEGRDTIVDTLSTVMAKQMFTQDLLARLSPEAVAIADGIMDGKKDGKVSQQEAIDTLKKGGVELADIVMDGVEPGELLSGFLRAKANMDKDASLSRGPTKK